MSLTNATATIQRINPTTGLWAAISGGTNLPAILDVSGGGRQRGASGAAMLGESFDGQSDGETLSLTGTSPTIREGDRVVVTPTGASSRTYRAGRPRIYYGTLAHQEIPLADYAPSGA